MFGICFAHANGIPATLYAVSEKRKFGQLVQSMAWVKRMRALTSGLAGVAAVRLTYSSPHGPLQAVDGDNG